MNKTLFKGLSLTIALVLILITVPMQIAQAAGEPAAPSQLEALSSYPGDLAISLSWSDNSLDETGFELDRCIGSGCTDFVLYATRDSRIYGPWLTEAGQGGVITV